MKTTDDWELEKAQWRTEKHELQNTVRRLRVKLDSYPKDIHTLMEAMCIINDLEKLLSEERYKNNVLSDRLDHYEELLRFFTQPVDKQQSTLEATVQ